MPSVEGTHNRRQVLVSVAILDAAGYRAHRASGEPILSGVLPFVGLIDTGATSTMLTPQVVAKLALMPVNKRLFHTVEGYQHLPAYLFHVAFNPPLLPRGSGMSPEDRASAIKVCPVVSNGGCLQDEDAPFQVLIGMDVICTGDLCVSRDGTFRFDF